MRFVGFALPQFWRRCPADVWSFSIYLRIYIYVVLTNTISYYYCCCCSSRGEWKWILFTTTAVVSTCYEVSGIRAALYYSSICTLIVGRAAVATPTYHLPGVPCLDYMLEVYTCVGRCCICFCWVNDASRHMFFLLAAILLQHTPS